MFDFSFMEIKVNIKKTFLYDVKEYLDYCKAYEIEPTREDMISFFKECAWEDTYQGLMDTDLDLEMNEVE